MKRIIWYKAANLILRSSLTPDNRCIAKITAIDNGADPAPLLNFEVNRLIPVSRLRRLFDEYTITFQDYNGSLIDQYTITEGSVVSPIPLDPTRTGYTFIGWHGSDGSYINPLATRTYPLPTPTRNVIYTAEYTRNPVYYDIHFETYDGVRIPAYDLHLLENSTIQAPAGPVRPGYTFVGWYDSNNNPLPATATSNGTYRAKYTQDSYTITWYDDQPGTGQLWETKQVAYGVIPSPDRGNPTKAGYTFVGWETASHQAPYAATGPETYYAKYSQVTYTIRFFDSQDFGGGQIGNDQVVAAGGTVTEAAHPTHNGYTFDGWNPAFSSTATQNVDYVATYTVTPPTTYTIYWYDSPIGVTGVTPWDTTTVNAGVIPTHAGPTPLESDKVFDHWETMNGERPYAADKDEHYYPVFVTPTPTTVTLTVTAGANGTATYNGQTTRNTTNTYTVNSGTSVTVSFAADSGYHINTVSVNGTSQGAVNSVTRTITSNTTVAVTFAQDAAQTYTIRFLNIDNTVLKTETLAAGATPTPPSDPTHPFDAGETNKAYEFSGWSPSIHTVDGNQDYIAQYSKNTWSISSGLGFMNYSISGGYSNQDFIVEPAAASIASMQDSSIPIILDISGKKGTSSSYTTFSGTITIIYGGSSAGVTLSQSLIDLGWEVEGGGFNSDKSFNIEDNNLANDTGYYFSVSCSYMPMSTNGNTTSTQEWPQYYHRLKVWPNRAA